MSINTNIYSDAIYSHEKLVNILKVLNLNLVSG